MPHEGVLVPSGSRESGLPGLSVDPPGLGRRSRTGSAGRAVRRVGAGWPVPDRRCPLAAIWHGGLGHSLIPRLWWIAVSCRAESPADEEGTFEVKLVAGSRWRSAVDTTEVVVVRAPEDEASLECGGHEMVAAGADGTAGASI